MGVLLLPVSNVSINKIASRGLIAAQLKKVFGIWGQQCKFQGLFPSLMDYN
jgi:hypothetical protein